jgi:hypothetical protein
MAFTQQIPSQYSDEDAHALGKREFCPERRGFQSYVSPDGFRMTRQQGHDLAQKRPEFHGLALCFRRKGEKQKNLGRGNMIRRKVSSRGETILAKPKTGVFTLLL